MLSLIFGLFSGFSGVKKLGLFAGVFIILALNFSVHSCNKKRKEKALIKHNTKKLDAKVKSSVEKTEDFSKIRKLENQKETNIKAKTVFVKKDCEVDCEVEIEELSIQERKKRKEKALRQLKKDFSF